MSFDISPLMAREKKILNQTLLKDLSEINDTYVSPLLKKQINDPNSRWDGGVTDRFEVPHAHAAMNFVIKLSGALHHPFLHTTCPVK